MELIEGSTVWLASAYIDAGAYKTHVYVFEATVFNREAQVLKVGNNYRQLHFGEKAFASEVEARSWAAATLEAAAARIADAARAAREKAAEVAAKGAVVYA